MVRDRVDPEVDEAITTCNTTGYELNPRRWGADPLSLFTRNLDGTTADYFLAVGEMTLYVSDFINYNAPDLDLVGGAIGVPDFFLVEGSNATRIDQIYSFVYAMDTAGRLRVDNGGLLEIPSEDLRLDPTQPAFYSMSSIIYWQP